jgi:hypothetical protein
MSTSALGSKRETGLGRRTSAGWSAPLAVLALAAMAGIVAWWTWRAMHDPRGWDLQPAYNGGRIAWASGHPERLPLWSGTPLLAAGMAVVSQLMSLTTAGHVITALNVILVLSAVIIVIWRLRSQLPPGWLWLLAFALLSFGPTMSTVWWKQFNIIAIALAVGGFELLRRGRANSAAGLIGLSIAIKPLAILLPFVLLARRETRRVGALLIGWIAALTVAAQVFLATRAHGIGVLSPWWALQNFVNKVQPGNGWACKTLNFAPGSLLCRIAGHQDWLLQHVVVWVIVALLGAWVISALRGSSATSWEVLAFTLPLSVMLSPLEWAHYQVAMVPLFVLLLVRFTQDGAGPLAWTGLMVSFVLVSLLWMPYGTVPGAVRELLSTYRETGGDLRSVDWVAQFGQYLLLITGLVWYARTPRATPGRVAARPAAVPSMQVLD